MATRTGDANLIKGAGVAYKNYDNTAGMYAGLDKVVKRGTEMMSKAKEGKEAEKIKLQKETEKQELKKEAQNQSWQSALDTAIATNGSFNTQADYNFSFDKLENTVKKDYLAALESGDKKALKAAEAALSTEKKYIDDMVSFRRDLTAEGNELSEAMSNTFGERGNDGRQKSTLTSFLNEDYKVSEKDGERYYAITDDNGKSKEYTLNDIKAMHIPKVTKNVNAYNNVFDTYAAETTKVERTVRGKVESTVPTNAKGLRAFVADSHFEGQNFRQLLDNDKNLASEVMKAFDDPTDNPNVMFDTDGSGDIDQVEFARMKDAIIDPYNDVWLTINEDGERKHDQSKWMSFTKEIVIDKLTNGIMNVGQPGDSEEENTMEGMTALQKIEYIKNNK
tara:strand:+ start:2130 stop:3305 length:1176 start_codon:yes stop_codon:yes gene_type:complete